MILTFAFAGTFISAVVLGYARQACLPVLTDAQRDRVSLFVAGVRGILVDHHRVSALRLHPLRDRPRHDPRHLQCAARRPEALLGHLWREYPQRRGRHRHVRVRLPLRFAPADASAGRSPSSTARRSTSFPSFTGWASSCSPSASRWPWVSFLAWPALSC